MTYSVNAAQLTQSLGGVWRNGRGQAPCPCCQPERRRGQNALSVTEQGGKLLLHCFKSNCSFVDIASVAGADLSATQVDFAAQAEHERKRRAYDADKLKNARDLWNAAKSIRGTKAEDYLRARGITCALPETLRFRPDILHAPSMIWGMAMIALVSTGAVHRTFFDKQGNRMRKSPKMMLGQCAGGAVRLSEPQETLVACEGIETGLSLASGLLSHPCEIWAALSTSGMRALHLPETPRKLIVATDGDDAGQEAGDKLADKAARLGWRVSLMPAPDGQDWNDILRERGST